jgi:hypothetical protein
MFTSAPFSVMTLIIKDGARRIVADFANALNDLAKRGGRRGEAE